MAHNELDSFFFKFKNLWQAGWDAKLSLKSTGGKTEVHLSVELGHAHVLRKSRSSPSRQRRRERRAAAREAEKAAEQVNDEQDVAVAINKDTKIFKKTPKDPVLDECCLNNIYLHNLVDDDDAPVEEIDKSKNTEK